MSMKSKWNKDHRKMVCSDCGKIFYYYDVEAKDKRVGCCHCGCMCTVT